MLKTREHSQFQKKITAHPRDGKKNDIQEREATQKKAVQERIAGQKSRRERNHRLFLSAGLMIEAGLVDTKTGELNFDRKKILSALKRVRCDLETSA